MTYFKKPNPIISINTVKASLELTGLFQFLFPAPASIKTSMQAAGTPARTTCSEPKSMSFDQKSVPIGVREVMQNILSLVRRYQQLVSQSLERSISHRATLCISRTRLVKALLLSFGLRQPLAHRRRRRYTTGIQEEIRSIGRNACFCLSLQLKSVFPNSSILRRRCLSNKKHHCFPESFKYNLWHN